jgi:hypothetical protein
VRGEAGQVQPAPCMYSHLQLIDDGAYPFRVRGIVNPKFVKLPTILVILKSQK